MRELLRNAWLGWQNYTDDGKLAALLLAALLFLWLRNKKVSQKGFLSYAVLMTACCIFPVTAVLLMLYQTKFYDYQWIWSLVPMTPVIAWGITEFLTEEAVVKGESAGKGPKKEGSYFPLRPACFFVLAAVLVLLCGSLGHPAWDVEKDQTQRAQCAQLLAQLPRQEQGASLCLWGPREVMEYARALDGSVNLIYGRNMWDEALNAYSYDVYPEQIRELYEQMCSLEETGQFLQDNGSGEGAPAPDKVLAAAVERGVNCFVLPNAVTQETLVSIEGMLGGQAAAVGSYYVIML